jgi:hypothetical protein
MNDHEHDEISGEVLSNFGKRMAWADRSEVDPDRLREVLTTTLAQHPDQAEIAALRDLGAHYFVAPIDADGFELRLGYYDLAILNPPGAVAGDYITLGIVKNVDI